MNAQIRTWLVSVAILLAASPRVSAQVPPVDTTTGQGPSLAVARNLYASAEYGGALDMLNGLLSDSLSTTDRQSIELYRTLCLVAVGNTAEANRIIDGMITREPLYRPAADDVPPRMRSAFTDARRRLLPSIIQQKYVVAKAAFDAKDYAGAADGFGQVLAGLGDPDIADVSAQAPLADLKMLATGFKDLAAKAIAPPPPPPAVVAEPPPLDRTPRVYSAQDTDVVPPITVRQSVPAYPGRVLQSGAAVIEVVIDESGGVESAVMEAGLNPMYDRLALTAAKAWQYQPASRNGKPVKYRKRIQISLVPETR